MAISKKAKFFASSLTAAVAVSAVAPTVFASELPADVADHEEADKVQLLMEAGVVQGFPDGTFQPGTSVTRAAAAKMLSVLLELDTENAPATDLTDVKEDVWYTGYVNALVAEGVINGYEDDTFRPNEELSRAEFAKMVVEAYGLEIAADADHPFTDVEDKWYKDYVVTLYANGLINGTTDTTFSPDAQLKRIDFAKLAVDTDIEHGTLLNSYLELNIDSIEAPAYNKVEVQFSQEVEEFDRNDVNFTDEDNNRVFASEVEIAEDNKSAYITFYEGLTDEATYDVTIKSGEETLESTFDYVEGDVAEVVVADVRIDPEKEYTVDYQVLSEAGVDVTGKYDATFKDTKGAVIDGKIAAGDLKEGETTFVEITVEDVTSDRFRIIAAGSNATDFQGFTVSDKPAADLVNDSNILNFKWEDEDNIRDYVKIGETAYLLVNLDNQYGEDAKYTDITFESLTPSVLVVDKTTGKLTPRAEGTASVRVKAGDVTQIISVDVLAAAKASAIEFKDLDGNTVDVSSKLDSADYNTANVTVQVVDQYGDAFTDGKTDTKLEQDGDVAGDSVDINFALASGKTEEALVTLTGINKDSGTTTIKVKYGTLKASLNFNVLEAGDTVGYELSGVKTLDKASDDADKNSTKLVVYPVDENGLKTGAAANAAFIITDKDEEELTDLSDGEITKADLAKLSVGTYTVEAKVGELVVAKDTFEVIDSTDPISFTQTSGKVSLTYTGAEDELNKALASVFEGKQGDSSVAATSFEYITNNSTVITNDGEVTGEGTATLYINKINGQDVDFEVEVTVTNEDFVLDTANLVVNFEAETAANYVYSFDGTNYSAVSATYEVYYGDKVTDTIYVKELDSKGNQVRVVKSVYDNAKGRLGFVEVK